MSTLPSFSSSGSGPLLLMLHGIGGGQAAFSRQVESFSQGGYRAAAWDMPGYGQSPMVEPYTFATLADACIRLLEHLLHGQGGRHAEGAILLGHSIGGMVALEVVARRPDLVERLILCGTSPAFGKADGDWQRAFIAQRTAPLDQGLGMADMAASLVPRMAGPQADPAGVTAAIACMGRVSQAAYRRALGALVTFDRRADLGSIRVPTLLLAGEHDGNAPSSVMKKMAQAIPGSAYLELEGIGHLQNLEAPDRFERAVLDFLGRA